MFIYSQQVLNALRKYGTHACVNSNKKLLMFNSLYLEKNNTLFLLTSSRHFQTSSTVCKSKSKSQLVHESFFNSNSNKSKETFIEALHKFRERERHLRGHVEFIYSALKYLEEFGVHRDLEVYKAILDLMPKGKMIPTNMFQEEFMHYPKHQHCAVQVLEKMEMHGVLPDSELQHILVNTFGKRGLPVRKFARMMYWMPKFKNACPWPLPEFLPDDALELAKLALRQINSIEPASKLTVMQSTEVEDSVDDTWIVSAISPAQEKLIAEHDKMESVKVEGPFGVFLQDQRISYFILRAEPKTLPPKPKRAEIDEVKNIFVWMVEEGTEEEKEMIKVPSVHEQEDGIILATCATGTSSRDSLLSWIRLLEKFVPGLSDIPVLFTQSSPIGDVILPPQTDDPPSPPSRNT